VSNTLRWALRPLEAEVASARTPKRKVTSPVSDEIDQHIDSIRSDARRQAALREWKSQYAPFSTNPFLTATLKPLEGPHLDLVEEFTKRALAAQLGEPRLILQGPDDQLYAARLFKPSDVRISRQYQSPRKPTWGEMRLVSRAHSNLIRDGRPATELQVEYGHHDSNDYAHGTWFVADNNLYEGSLNYRWGNP
jgi:hypothetical protein